MSESTFRKEFKKFLRNTPKEKLIERAIKVKKKKIVAPTIEEYFSVLEKEYVGNMRYEPGNSKSIGSQSKENIPSGSFAILDPSATLNDQRIFESQDSYYLPAA